MDVQLKAAKQALREGMACKGRAIVGVSSRPRLHLPGSKLHVHQSVNILLK